MTSALLESPFTLPVRGGPPSFARGRPATLEERLDRIWRALSAGERADCPICRAPMRLEDGAGRCGSCGSRLS
jgi:hypothetical protein